MAVTTSAVAMLSFATIARADVDPVAAFEWEAPEGCPSEASVKESVRGLVRNEPARGGMRIRAVATAGSPWRAHIRIEHEDERGERELAASSCEALGQAVALVVALAMDRAETAPSEAEPTSSVAVSVPVTPTTPRAERPSDSRPGDASRLATHAGLAVRSGLVPSAAPGMELGMAWTRGALEIAVTAALFARSSITTRGPDVGTSRRATGSFLLATAQARVGWSFGPTPAIRVVPFGGIGLAYLRGDGRGVDVVEEAADWLPMPLAGVEGRVRLGRSFEPYVTFDAGLPLGRSSFQVREMNGPVFRPEVVSLHASGGVRFLLF